MATLRRNLLAIAALSLWGAIPLGHAQPPPDLLRQKAVLTLPGMESVRVDTGIVFAEPEGRALKLDFFRPVRALRGRAPVVVFVNGVGLDQPPLRRWGIYQSWGRLAAQSGLAAVTHDVRRDAPREDLEALITHLRSNATRYGIDPDNIAIWACSANLQHGSWYALNPAHSFIKAAVFYYGNVDTTFLRPELPVLVGRAGLDNAFTNGSLDFFLRRALARNAAVTVINLPNGRHAFDLFDDHEASRDVVRQTLAFLQANLSSKTQAARAERAVQVRAVDRVTARDWEGTLAAVEAWLREEPEAGPAFQYRGDANYQLRRYAEAGQAYQRAGELRHMPGITFYNAGCSWALAGDKERALANLEASVATGFVTDRQAIAADPDLVSLKGEPRFQKLVEGR